MTRIFFEIFKMSFKKMWKRINKGQATPQGIGGQATLEYFILFLAVTLGVMSFLWFSWPAGATRADAQGQARNIAQAYFSTMSQEILAPATPQ